MRVPTFDRSGVVCGHMHQSEIKSVFSKRRSLDHVTEMMTVKDHLGRPRDVLRSDLPDRHTDAGRAMIPVEWLAEKLAAMPAVSPAVDAPE